MLKNKNLQNPFLGTDVATGLWPEPTRFRKGAHSQSCPQGHGYIIGVTGFEPATCRRGDRSTRDDQGRRGPVQFLESVPFVSPRCAYRTAPCASKSTARHASLLLIRRRYGGGIDRPHPRKTQHNADLFSGSAGCTHKTWGNGVEIGVT